MTVGIFRPRSAVQRVTVNAGNRAFIAGGRGPGRALPPGPAPAPAPPPPPPPPPEV